MYSIYLPDRTKSPVMATPQGRVFFNNYNRPTHRLCIRLKSKRTCKQCEKLSMEKRDLKYENNRLRNNVEQMLKDTETNIWKRVSNTLDELKKQNRRLEEMLANEQRKRFLGNISDRYVDMDTYVCYDPLDMLRKSADMERLLQEKDRETCNLKRRIIRDEIELKRLEELRTDAVCNVRKLQQRINELEWKLNNNMKERCLQWEIARKEREIQNLRRQIDEEKLKYGKQQDTFLFNIKKLEEEKEKSTRLLTMSYEQEKRIIVTEKNQLQETIRILKNEKKKLQEDLADMKCMTGGTEMKSLQLEIQRNQTALRNFQEKIAEKERKNVELTRRIQMEIEEKDSVMETNEQQQRDIYSLKEKVRFLEQGMSRYTVEWSRSTDTEKELDQLRGKARDMEQDLVNQRESNKLNDTEKELNQLQLKMKNMEEEKIRLVEKLNRSSDKENKLITKIKEMDEEKEQQLKRSNAAENELDRLQSNLKQMEEQQLRLTEQLYRSNDTEKELHELQAMLTKKEEEKRKLERQLDILNDKEKETDGLRVIVESIEEEKTILERQLKEANYTEKELGQLRNKVENLKEENENLKRLLIDNTNELSKNTAALKTLEENNEKLTAENRHLLNAHVATEEENGDLVSRTRADKELKLLIREIEDKNVKIEQLQTEVRDFQMSSNKCEKELFTMKKQKDRLEEEICQLSNENTNLRKETVEVSRQKEDALERLSRLAGARLTHGNAAITDLSDTDRPTKIAEKFSELYDNAWTDAFEELDSTYHNEKETINVLLKILQEAYSFCVRTEQDYEDRIRRAVFTLADEREITTTDVAVQKALADLRISLGNECCSVIEEMFLSKLPSILRDIDVAACPKTKEYARQCASLCWRMRIREPPVFIRFEFRQGTSFNSDVLRKFTKTGGYLEFLVWPALYLHENGPLLAKGVAQPKLAP
uniref:Mitochondria-eating protein n=1 Tax=Crassostrea virginica TaxID=6565 RepID=A0A8B8DD77_CRAVI|nr:trichohyalin-like isoform X2 [Crassostrea virginica]